MAMRCILLVVLMLCWFVLEAESKVLSTERDIKAFPVKRGFDGPDAPFIEGGCTAFLHKPKALLLRGGLMTKVGDGLPPDRCKAACLQSRDIICTAAQVQHPANCFITGYRLQNHYYSNHYRRVCDHGPACFEKTTGVTAGFSRSLAIPWYYYGHEDLQPLFCMARCETFDACLGFDLTIEDKKPTCYFQNIGISQGHSFDLFLRKC